MEKDYVKEVKSWYNSTYQGGAPEHLNNKELCRILSNDTYYEMLCDGDHATDPLPYFHGVYEAFLDFKRQGGHWGD